MNEFNQSNNFTPPPTPEPQIEFFDDNKLEVEKSGITMDKIIEKFIPIVGVLFLTIGVAYLLYTSVWVHLDMVLRLGLGFFLSLVLIGGSYSFSEKWRYFADLGIGSGILLLYSTLIYGSRTTDLATAAIPEIATLVTAFIFTLAVSYFSLIRRSKAILILGMIGAYITPFVIGQNGVWVQNISFNAYLMYFLAINVAVYLLGREISVRNIIPLNIAGLFIGTSTLYHLSYSDGISKIVASNFLTGEIFSAILFFVLVVFSIWSILLSAKKFEESDDGYLALGYLAPMFWFIFSIGRLTLLTDIFRGVLFALLAVVCFLGWHALNDEKTRFQHTALYAAGFLAAIQAFFAFIPQLDIYSSIAIAYSSLIFGIIFTLKPDKNERFFGYIFLSSIGAALSLVHIYEKEINYQTLYAVIALVPAMCAFLIAKVTERSDIRWGANRYSIFAAALASVFIFKELIDYVDLSFMLFYLVPLLILVLSIFTNKEKHDSESTLLRFIMAWFAIGFAGVFLSLVGSIYPAPTNTFIITHTDLPTDWILVKGIFATIILFVGLFISRKLQSQQIEKRPSFLLVIFGYSTLLLTGNYITYALMNDFGVSMSQGGPRAIATTIWWTLIALYMLIIGIKNGTRYHAEKLLGLILLSLTVGKILLYDLSTMAMQNKIIVLMIIGFALVVFSYGVHSRGWLKEENRV
ncbi:MAG TPA: hypothetical protein DEA43_04640 [Candidatus Moranbacteria bacterium]|nr:hypothetical protein [Candidatus Moranbacteria bacterium]HBT46141.1 hypothetical protein [Candidatus Moranbacteria bacterium]